MYLDGEDFQTVWRLAHKWVNADPNKSDLNALSPALMQAIHRLLSAIVIRDIVARIKRISILDDDSIGTVIFDSLHHLKINTCLRKDEFDKDYLDSIYVKRSEVLNWCDKERITPPLWVPKNPSVEQKIQQALQVDGTIDSVSSITSDTEAFQLQQREAAYVRHQPTENLKQDCIHYWLQHQNYSNNKAAGKFYEALPPEMKKLLSASNAARTLAQAISEYRNREKLIKQGKIPHWLANFNPENFPS